MRRLLVLVLPLVACAATPTPFARGGPPANGADALELFRRARFAELAATEDASVVTWVHRLRPSHVAEGEDVADWTARLAYRRGDGAAARAALNGLPALHSTRATLEALLDHVDVERPLRALHGPELVSIPLAPDALALGLPVVELTIAGRRLRMVWDTAATENLLSLEAAAELDLVRSRVHYAVRDREAGWVVRFEATGTPAMSLGGLEASNVPWLVADLGADRTVVEAVGRIDGFLSPQLLLADGCFELDRLHRRLRVGRSAAACRAMLAAAPERSPLFVWGGEVFASAQLPGSPELAVRLETGSPVTFLRADAARWLPEGAIERPAEEGELAETLARAVPLSVAGQVAALRTIDLAPSRRSSGHDDVATVGTDVLLQGRGVVVSFRDRVLAVQAAPAAVAAIDE